MGGKVWKITYETMWYDEEECRFIHERNEDTFEHEVRGCDNMAEVVTWVLDCYQYFVGLTDTIADEDHEGYWVVNQDSIIHYYNDGQLDLMYFNWRVKKVG